MKVPRIATSVSHIDSDLIIGAANSTKIAKKKILINLYIQMLKSKKTGF